MSLRELFILPEAIPLLLLVPLVWFLLRSLDRAGEKRLASLVGPVVKRLAPDLGAKERRLRRHLVVAGFFLALVALLQPVRGAGGPTVELRGVDLMVCLDVSQSMLARDMPPSRLERARAEIAALADNVPLARLGLVVFAGEARLLSPLTTDMKSYLSILSGADPLSVRRGGTDLGGALERALKALDESRGGSAAMLLITDGEDLGERGLSLAKKCGQSNAKIFCVGFGSVEGSKIAIDTEGEEVFLRDREGREVVSSMDSSGLRRIAEAAGGEFVEAGTRMMPLVELFEKRIAPLACSTFQSEERRRHGNRYQWPLLAAFFLWLLELCLTDRMKK